MCAPDLALKGRGFKPRRKPQKQVTALAAEVLSPSLLRVGRRDLH
jgi:hypothetical protein